MRLGNALRATPRLSLPVLGNDVTKILTTHFGMLLDLVGMPFTQHGAFTDYVAPINGLKNFPGRMICDQDGYATISQSLDDLLNALYGHWDQCRQRARPT